MYCSMEALARHPKQRKKSVNVVYLFLNNKSKKHWIMPFYRFHFNYAANIKSTGDYSFGLRREENDSHIGIMTAHRKTSGGRGCHLLLAGNNLCLLYRGHLNSNANNPEFIFIFCPFFLSNSYTI